MTIKPKLTVAISTLFLGVLTSVPALAQGGEGAAARRSEDPAARLIKRFDGNDDGTVTLAEYLAGEKRRFAEADIDGDGYVTTAELEAVAAIRASRRSDRVMERLDTDTDGRISQAEAEALGVERAMRRFVRLDTDQDGFVTKSEIDDARDRSVTRIQARIMARFDANGDDRISAVEADITRERRFARIDRDRDGAVTVAELRESLKRRPRESNRSGDFDR